MRRAVDIGIVDFVGWCASELGVFFVRKKDGRLRLIVDCRRTNQLFLDPPGVDLVTGEGLSKIELDWEEPPDFMQDICIAFGEGDVSDCFHRMRWEGGIRNYFCWPPVLAGEVGVTMVEGISVKPGTKIWPAQKSLPMGFTWALYFAQSANIGKFGRVPSLQGAHRQSDRGTPWVIQPGAESLAYYTYVDNLGALCENVKRVDKVMQEAEKDFKKDGLLLHEIEVGKEGGSALGIVLDGRRFETRNTLKRFGLVRKSISAILNRKRVCVWMGGGSVDWALYFLRYGFTGGPCVFQFCVCFYPSTL